jgi:hypothetical protein
MTVLQGSCLCGAVEFEFATEELDVTACHCGQCRRWSGHYWAAFSGPREGLSFTGGEDKIGWFKSSDLARRGFCRECGSALFWHGEGIEAYKDRISVGAGAIKGDPPLQLTQHIFVDDKGCYYEIADGLPQKDA